MTEINTIKKGTLIRTPDFPQVVFYVKRDQELPKAENEITTI